MLDDLAPSLPGDGGVLLSVLLLASFVWLAWAYLRGPHNLRRLFGVGDAPTPATSWRGKIFVGLGFVRISYGYLTESTSEGSPIFYLMAVGGAVLVLAGLAEGWRLRGRGRD